VQANRAGVKNLPEGELGDQRLHVTRNEARNNNGLRCAKPVVLKRGRQKQDYSSFISTVARDFFGAGASASGLAAVAAAIAGGSSGTPR